MIKNVFIAFGSNIGERKNNMDTALSKIAKKKFFQIEKISSIYETEPVSSIAQGNYYNSVILCSTTLSPFFLLEFLHNIENELGRKRAVAGGERIIDLDIIFYNNLCLNTNNLILPHSKICERGFVLAPLNEISPEFIHPAKGIEIRKIFKKWKNSKFSNEGRIIKVFTWKYNFSSR